MLNKSGIKFDLTRAQMNGKYRQNFNRSILSSLSNRCDLYKQVVCICTAHIQAILVSV